MFARPATGTISPALVSVILCGVPVHAEEHLVQGWDALSAALRASEVDDRSKVEVNISFAKMRLAHAVGAVQSAKFGKREALKVECIELAKAIDDAARYF